MVTPMHSYPRPKDRHLFVERVPIDGACPECGEEKLASYPVLSDGGWWDVKKCQGCLASVERVPGPRFGSFTPLADMLD